MNKKEREIFKKKYEKMRREIHYKFWYQHYKDALEYLINLANDTIEYYKEKKGEKKWEKI